MKQLLASPARLTAFGFLLLIIVGSVLLMMPFAGGASFLSALFTATSAVSLTGLVVEDTATFFHPAGQVIILVLIQLGGLGIMSLASLSGYLLTGRISFKARKTGAYEGRPITSGGIRRTLIFTFTFTAVAEATIAVAIGARLMLGYGYSFPQAAWEGVFHAISAFNNAGFSTHSDNLVSFSADAWILLPLAAALIGGGLGFPVWAELVRRKVSMTARMTLWATAMLLTMGMLFFALAEWHGVLSSMPLGQKLLNAFFASASPRTAGFNAVDYGQAHPITLMGTDMLMFLGGGSAGTAGGVKVTTFCVLLAAMAAEFRGQTVTTIGHRSVPHTVTRQALALSAAGVAVVVVGVATLRIFDPQFTADQVTFEVISAFATSGLSTGITAELSATSKVVLCLIMYLGRVGPTTLVAALAARTVDRRFSYPEERPFIG
ncbi:TrkH family potassium uptake protein [Corynebacterium sp. p3-SID1056]|uniref:TrkH family potassium uptake protein n=1 Tax=Corynebacterium sp. p3-SID1056 TaxID=2916092 RepID=UPI0021A2BB72|nr:potassium transporter TrkG [Corynebacterium sp. p3-SID1056]MCT2339026.1 TrkH family potassium uptake protein [Corynebacterium sp. p3-SID1056]